MLRCFFSRHDDRCTGCELRIFGPLLYLTNGFRYSERGCKRYSNFVAFAARVPVIRFGCTKLCCVFHARASPLTRLFLGSCQHFEHVSCVPSFAMRVYCRKRAREPVPFSRPASVYNTTLRLRELAGLLRDRKTFVVDSRGCDSMRFNVSFRIPR